ncbi:MAG: ATP-binding protein [Deltaproteobacteria bacterium]|nr:ATP-binding protein [Deltaproteobacteria bacterium]
MARTAKKKRRQRAGKLRIGDSWNAITIIARSQTNPLKAVAEFVENSIDARAGRVTITRGKKKGRYYLKVTDDGEGIPRDQDGLPNFQYVATHICDSIKRRLKSRGIQGIQGEFGIGLLSFWTVGEKLFVTSSGADGKTYQMTMARDSREFSVTQRRLLFPPKGTELLVYPLLPGLRSLTGEKIQRYLASELRDRIKRSGVEITVVDRTGRAQYIVEPRRFTGRLLHELRSTETPLGDVYLEIYLNEPNPANRIGLYRSGTRVLPNLCELEAFQQEPWNAGYLQGIVDVPFLNLTPGTRHGVIRDERFEMFCQALQPVSEQLRAMIEEQRKAEEERSSRQILRKVQRALKEAFLCLPSEDYDWFDIDAGRAKKKPGRTDPISTGSSAMPQETASSLVTDAGADSDEEFEQKAFFEFSGPLFSVRIAPRSAVVSVDHTRTFRAVCRDRSRRMVRQDLSYQWEIKDGEGVLDTSDAQSVRFTAPADPGLTTLKVTAMQADITCSDEALVTVTDSLLDQSSASGGHHKGLPGYTYRRMPGEMWRSKYDADQNVVVINNGHRDFVYAARKKARKLRYICRLFCKELVLNNFPGLQPHELLERMIELSMYTEEHLK